MAQKKQEKVSKAPYLGQSQTKIFGIEVGIAVDQRIIRWTAFMLLELLVIVVVVMMVLIPKWDELQKIRKSVRQTRTQVADLARKQEILDDFAVSYATQYAFISQALLPDKDIGVILTSLRSLANRAGVSIDEYELNPGEVFSALPPAPAAAGRAGTAAAKAAAVRAAAPPSAVSLRVNLAVNGTPENIGVFLQLMDTSLPIKNIQNLGVQGEVVNGLAQFRLALEIDFYQLPIITAADAKQIIKPLGDADLELLQTLSAYVRTETAPVGTGSAVILGNENLFGL